MAVSRKSAGVKIPNIFLRNDGDSSTTGQITISKAGTVALDLSGSAANIQIEGVNAQIVMSGSTPAVHLSGAAGQLRFANSGGTVGTLSIGAGNALIFQIGATTGTIIDV